MVQMCILILSPGVFVLFFQKVPSVALDISETIHNMIVICGSQVQNDNMCRGFFYFFKILIFWIVRRVKGQKVAK